MSGVRQGTRRTIPVVILDATLAVAAAVQSGHLPWIGRRGPRTRRAAMIWVTVAVVAVAAGTLTLVVAFLRSPGGLAPLGVASAPPQAAAEMPSSGASPGPTAGPTGTPGTGARDPGASPAPAPPGGGRPGRDAGGAATGAQPVALPLTARYSTSEGPPGLLGYGAEVAIANPGGVRTSGWRLTITLPRSTLSITDVVGATVRQEGSTWHFTPAAGTAAIPAGGSARVSFQVRGATLVSAAPTACAIDGRACAGLTP